MWSVCRTVLITSLKCCKRRVRELLVGFKVENMTTVSDDLLERQQPTTQVVKVVKLDDSCEVVQKSPSPCNFTVDKTAYTVVKEGRAEVLFPNSHDVFYNPVQEFNRDLSIAVIREYVKDHFLSPNKKNEELDENCFTVSHNAGVQYDDGVTILEALAASGLRSIRYALEIPGVKRIVANDMSSQAVESISRNIAYNKVEHLVSESKEDAALCMYKHRRYKERFHIIDLDPYGSPSMFLDAALQAIHDGGLLLVTCTDMAVLCGNGSETCHAKYGAVSLKSKCCHEMALRIVLHCVESHANRYGRYIEPVLSLSADFYVRIFVKVFTSPSKVKQTTSKLALVFQCVGCETFTLQSLGKCVAGPGKNFKYFPATGPVVGPNCVHCGHRQQLGGPIWNGKLHNFEFVERIVDSLIASPTDFKTHKRIQGTLNVILEELPDVPLYYSMDRLSSTLHSICPKMVQFRSALLNAGYQVSLSHACKTSIKTNAPVEFLWDIMRHWIAKNPLKREPSENSPAKTILAKEASHEVSFELHPDANPDSRKNKLVRFQENPEKYWGPKMRAKTSLLSESQNDKSIRKQGKRSRPPEIGGVSDMKQYPCKRFKQGQCDLGDDCKYSHDLVQLNSSNESGSPPT